MNLFYLGSVSVLSECCRTMHFGRTLKWRNLLWNIEKIPPNQLLWMLFSLISESPQPPEHIPPLPFGFLSKRFFHNSFRMSGLLRRLCNPRIVIETSRWNVIAFPSLFFHISLLTTKKVDLKEFKWIVNREKEARRQWESAVRVCSRYVGWWYSKTSY